ncbi:hypothetical protein C6P42_005160, partial [Pichia californica]
DAFNELISKMEKEIDDKDYKHFLDIFSLPTHSMLHLLEKLKDIGSYRDIWCFVMERTCKEMRSMVLPNRNSCKSLNERISMKAYNTISFFSQYKSYKHTYYEYTTGRLAKESDNVESRKREFKRSHRLGNISDSELS